MLKQESNQTAAPLPREHFGTADLLKENEKRNAMPQDTPAIEGNVALFPASDLENLRTRWRDIQGGFVDEPRNSVQKADELVAEAIRRLTEVFAGERDKMEKDWGNSRDISTEDLRQALRRYRSFFDRLLSV